MLLCLDCCGNERHTLSFAILMTHLQTAWFYCFSEKLSKVRLILDTLIKFMMIMMMIKSFTHRQSLIQHSLVHSFILSFVRSFFVHHFVLSFVDSSNHSSFLRLSCFKSFNCISLMVTWLRVTSKWTRLAHILKKLKKIKGLFIVEIALSLSS